MNISVLVLARVDSNFFQSSSHGAVFWICAENSVDNTGMV